MNRDEILEFLNANPGCHLATVEGDQPRVRGMFMYRADEKGIIFHTGAFKSLYSQLRNNKNVEACFNSPETQVRVAGVAEVLRDEGLKKEIFEARPWLKPLMGQQGEDALIVFRLTGCVVSVWTMETNLERTTYVNLYEVIMKATQQLKDEHEGLLLMLRILGEVSRQLQAEGHMENEHFESILEFLKVFVDKCHHGKEEELLFPALMHVGIPQDGPIAVMLFEHEMGRKYIRMMTDAFERYKLRDASAASTIAQNARDYIELLTDHIDKENNILFAMADDRLSEKTQEELFEGFEKIETARIGTGKHQEFHDLLHRLSDIYLKGK